MSRKVPVPVWWLLFLSLMTGFGLAWVLEQLPRSWSPWVVMAVALAAIPWAIREYRWAGRQRKAIEADIALIEAMNDDKDFPW